MHQNTSQPTRAISRQADRYNDSLRSNQHGTTAVEAAIVLPVFLLLLFAILDLGRLFFTEITLQNAMREGGRFGVTGQHLPDPKNPGTLQSRLASIQQTVQQWAIGVTVDPKTIVISSANGGAGSAGGPGDTLTISMTYSFSFATPLIGKLFPGGVYPFTVSTSFRNEPFPPGAAK